MFPVFKGSLFEALITKGSAVRKCLCRYFPGITISPFFGFHINIYIDKRDNNKRSGPYCRIAIEGFIRCDRETSRKKLSQGLINSFTARGWNIDKYADEPVSIQKHDCLNVFNSSWMHVNVSFKLIICFSLFFFFLALEHFCLSIRQNAIIVILTS